MSVATDEMASLLWCHALAISDDESIRFPVAMVYR